MSSVKIKTYEESSKTTGEVEFVPIRFRVKKHRKFCIFWQFISNFGYLGAFELNINCMKGLNYVVGWSGCEQNARGWTVSGKYLADKTSLDKLPQGRNILSVFFINHASVSSVFFISSSVFTDHQPLFRSLQRQDNRTFIC